MADDYQRDFDDPSRINTSTPRPRKDVELTQNLEDNKKENSRERSEKQKEKSSKLKDTEKRTEKSKKEKESNKKTDDKKSGDERKEKEKKPKEKDGDKKLTANNREPKKSKMTKDVNEKVPNDYKETKTKCRKASEEMTDDGSKDEDEESEEEEETEMTNEEKEDLYNAVRNGEWMTLQDCLEKKNADVNMTWYKENLLMAAIRSEQTEIAEFLIDIGIDFNYRTKYFHLRNSEKKGKRIDCHEKSCRDLAFDLDNDHIVECIDVKNNNIFPFVPVKPRHIWSKRPPAPPIPKEMLPPEMRESDDEDDDSDEDSGDRETDSGHPSPRSHDKNTEDTLFSEMLGKLNDGRDDGYGTMSPSYSPYLGHFSPHVYTPPEKPLVFHRATKASMALQTHNDICYKERRVPSKSAPVVRNVKAVGSYVIEKRKWEIQRERSYVKDDTISVQSLPFFPSCTSASTSRRSSAQSTYSSPTAEVAKILGQSSLLRRNSDFKQSTHDNKCTVPSLKINQWCHKNSNNVFNRLSKSAQQRKLPTVNRDFSHHSRW